MKRLITLIPAIMFAALLAACGSASTTSTSSSTATTPTAKTVCPTVAIGTIQDVSNNSLQVTSLQGKQAQVTFTSATTFIRTSTIAPSGIQTGSLASVTIIQYPNNTYSALSVSIRNPQLRQGGFTRGSSQCRGQFTRRFGTPVASGSGSGLNRQVVSGTISQVSGNSLTLSSQTGDDFIVNLTPITRITTQVAISPSTLKNGEAVMITGLPNGQGVIKASSISILQSLPSLRPTATSSAQ